MGWILASQRPFANPDARLTRLLRRSPSTVTTSSAKHGGITCAVGVFAITDLGVTRLSGTVPCTPQSSHAFTSAECEYLMGGVMEIIDHNGPLLLAQQYFGTTSPVKRLGWGITGHVYLSPDLVSAVKIHRRSESFWQEFRVYQRLRRLKLNRLLGLTIPTLRGYRTDLRAIHMDLVTPPFLLDFAGATLDQPPDFPEGTVEAGIEERFGTNAPFIYAVQRELERHGIYYTDFRASNLDLTGLPGLQANAPDDDS